MVADDFRFGGASNRGDDARVQEPSDLHARQPHAAGRAGDEDRFAGLDLRAMMSA